MRCQVRNVTKNFNLERKEAFWNSVETRTADVSFGKEWWEKEDGRTIPVGCCVGRLTGVKLG